MEKKIYNAIKTMNKKKKRKKTNPSHEYQLLGFQFIPDKAKLTTRIAITRLERVSLMTTWTVSLDILVLACKCLW